MTPQAFARRAFILRAVSDDDGLGGRRAEYRERFTRFCQFTSLAASRQVVTGGLENHIEALARLRDDADVRTVTIEDRLRLDGRDYAIVGVQPYDPVTGTITFQLRSSSV